MTAANQQDGEGMPTERDWLEGLPEDQDAACKHESCSFDRSVCACGSMHDYCDECGAAMDCPLDAQTQEPSAAYEAERCRHDAQDILQEIRDECGVDSLDGES